MDADHRLRRGNPGHRDRLREALAAHLSSDGVWFGSRAWIVNARRS